MIDSHIYAQFAPKVKSVADYQSDMAANEAAQLQNMLARQKGSEYLAGVQRQGQVRNALMGLGASATDDDRIAALKATATPEGFTQADALAKAMQDRAQSAAKVTLDTAHAGNFKSETAQRDLGTQQQKVAATAQGLANVNQPEDAVGWYEQAVKSGLLSTDQAVAEIDKMPTDPKGFSAWKSGQQQKGMTLLQQIEDRRKQEEEAGRNTRNTQDNQTRVQTTGMTNATTRRGQDMTDARSRESTSATMSKPFEVTGPDGQPLLVQQDKQGNIAPVQGFGPKTGATKPLTDSQAKALGFGTRMQEADKLLGTMESQGVKTPSIIKQGLESVPGIGGALGAAANVAGVASPEQQQVEQAQRDFVNAILRRESGAAISSSEFDNARKQYFPQPGDSPPVLAQKARNRKLAAEGVMAEVPKGQRGSIGPQAAQNPIMGIDPNAIAAELAKRGH